MVFIELNNLDSIHHSFWLVEMLDVVGVNDSSWS